MCAPLVSARAHCFSRYSSFSSVRAPAGATYGTQSDAHDSRALWSVACRMMNGDMKAPKGEGEGEGGEGEGEDKSNLPDSEAHIKELLFVNSAVAIDVVSLESLVGDRSCLSGNIIGIV